MKVIAFTGLKGSGKDTAASVFTEAGYEHVKMAGALKAMLAELMRYQGANAAMVDASLEGHLKELPSPYLAGRTPREALQTLGTEWGREMMAPDIWTRMTAARCRLFRNVVISDVRFPNEVEMVHRLDGMVIRIERGGEAAAHASEAQIRNLAADLVVFNDFGSPECFKAFIKARFLRP